MSTRNPYSEVVIGVFNAYYFFVRDTGSDLHWTVLTDPFPNHILVEDLDWFLDEWWALNNDVEYVFSILDYLDQAMEAIMNLTGNTFTFDPVIEY